MAPRHDMSRVLLMSDQSDGAIEEDPAGTPPLFFLPKPLTGDALNRKIREVLDTFTS